METIETAEVELRQAIKSRGGTTINMPDEMFSAFCKSLSKKARELFLEKYRDDREFYKNILKEESREKFPNSFRYKDASEKLQQCNAKGLIIKNYIDLQI